MLCSNDRHPAWLPAGRSYNNYGRKLHNQESLRTALYWPLQRFVTEAESKRALPQDGEFWSSLFRGASQSWGLAVYEQDWQDRQFVQMEVSTTL